VILGIENPLLDISVHIDQSFLDKYQLKAGLASLAQPKDLPLFNEIITFPDVEYIAGGSCQNSIRGAQWMSPTSKITHFIGSIGNDENGKKLKAASEADGVQTHFYISPKSHTGSCAVLIKDKERCLCADLAAANDYSHEHYLSEEIQKLLENVDIVYTTGFFLTVSPQTMVEIGKHCVEKGKLFVFLVAAPFLCEFFWDQMQSVLPFADIVIANESEAIAFGKKAGFTETDIPSIAKNLSNLPKANQTRPRTVIFTQGPDPTIVYDNGQIKEFPVAPVPKEEIVDLNGAGDAFCGGLLAGLAHNKSLEECIKAGHYASHHILHVSGTQYSGKSNFQWS